MAALLVLVVLILASLSVIAALMAAFRFPAEVPSFRCKIRTLSLEGAERRRWPRRRCRAAWVHDVLLVRRGLLLVDVAALPVRVPQERLRNTGPDEVRHLGL